MKPSPLPFRWARVTLAVAFVGLVGLWSCGRVAQPPVCLEVVVDSLWPKTPDGTDSVLVLRTWCREWER